MSRRVAVTGFGVVSPIGVGREAFWHGLAEGRPGVAPITRFDAETFEVRLAGEVKEELELPVDVRSVADNDVKVGFGFVACAEALAQAAVASFDESTLLHVGTSLEVFDLRRAVVGGGSDFKDVVRRSLNGGPPLQIPLDTTARLLTKHFGRPAQALTNCSACAAGAQAIGHGFRAVRDARVERAVCGGCDSMIHPLGVGGFQLLGALTTENVLGAAACRPFDAARSGTVLGEGAAFFVLEALERALAEGRPVLAEVCGYGASLDAHGLSAPDPDGAGAVRAMRAALDDAGLAPDAIEHINAHGTGTALNDEIEARAIRAVFAEWQHVPVSATKSMTGHLIAAAGALEVGACLLPLQRDVLPPNISLERVGPGCELDHVTAPRTTWGGRHVLSNSFGFGGQNAALILRRHDA
jgi:3-oxoacyl-[acyl-carrier-protein] synthase II